nr:hypothetical protein [Tanacetum cinerariifolium]
MVVTAKFLNFLDIPHTDAENVSSIDVHVHHEVPSQKTPTLITVPVLFIFDSSPLFSTVIPHSLPSFTPPPQQSTSTPPPTTEAINPPSTLPDFASVIQFNNRVTTLEKEVAELKKDPLHTQVTALVDDHLDARLGATRDEFMNFLLIVKESLEDVILAKVSSQPQSLYEAAATLTEFELKKILIDKIDKIESYLEAPEHRECYEGPRVEEEEDCKDEEQSKGPKVKESQLGSSKGDKSQSKSLGRSVQSEEPKFKVADSDMPQDQPTQPQEPTDPDWNVGKTPQQGHNQSWLMTLASSAEKPSKTFDELMSTPIDISAFIMNGLNINNFTQEKLLGPTFRLLKGTQLCRVGVEVIRKHRYGYLQEIVVRRADNDLYRFKEGDFQRLRINDIEDMLLLVVQNWLTNLSGDDVSDFAIALRISPEACDDTLTRLRTSLGDITKNIRIEYLPKRRWSTLEKKRTNIMIKAIDKQLKERRMMRSLKKFVGGRDYGTDLWLLQRTI